MSFRKIGNFSIQLFFYFSVVICYAADNDSIQKKLKKTKELTVNELESVILSYAEQNQYKNALIYAEKLLNQSKKKNDDENEIKASCYISKFLYFLGKTEIAASKYEQVLVVLKPKDSLIITQIKLDLGLFYSELNQFKKALVCYQSINPTLVKILDYEASYYNNFANIYYGIGDSKNSIFYSKKTLELDRKANDLDGMQLSYSNLGSDYIGLKQFKTALAYLDSAQAINTGRKNFSIESQIQENKFLLFRKMGNLDSAFYYLEQLKKTNELIINQRVDEEIEDYKNSLKREKKLQLKMNFVDTKIERYERQFLLWAIFIVLIIIAVLFFGFYRSTKKNNKLILLEQRLLRSQMTPHFIFNSLTVLQGMILNKENTKAVTYLSKFSKLMRIILENSREKLIPLNLELSAIKNYVELQTLQMDKEIIFSVEITEMIDVEEVLIPSMIIQPFVENAIEHGFRAENPKPEILIKITESNGFIRCEIVDNGVGISVMSKKSNPNKKSVSTAITNERLALLTKEFRKKSSVNVANRQDINGTIVTLILPIIT